MLKMQRIFIACEPRWTKSAWGIRTLAVVGSRAQVTYGQKHTALETSDD